MKNKTKILIVLWAIIVVMVCATLALTGCKDGGNDADNNGANTPAQFEGITFADVVVDFDAQEHAVVISGTLPEGAEVTYTNNKATEVGTYNATATVAKFGYATLTLHATLRINGLTFVGITFADTAVDYNGQQQVITIDGALPAGAVVEYSGNKATDVGTYNATATISARGYETLTLNAQLVINKATFAGIEFESSSYSYDGLEHSVLIAGVLPENTSVSYRCQENASITNAATESGTYTIQATIANANYHTLVLTATLTISGSDKERHIAYYNGTLYFANALDDDKLYSYDSTTGIAKVSNDVPYDFAAAGGSLYFRSYSIIYSNIKVIGNGVQSVAAEKGEYLVSNGSVLYYAVNALSNEKSGIYRLDVGAGQSEGTLISRGKAKYLTCIGSTLYFADGANGWKLSSVSVNGGDRRLVVDEKISCLTASGNTLYFTVHNLLGSYIARFNVNTDTELTKMTIDAGANLTVIGSQLYYINVDLATSALYGKGIYAISVNAAGLASGTKIIGNAAGDKFSSLTVADGRLAYYRVSDQMLCLYDLSTGAEQHVLEGFVPTANVPITTGSKTAAYGHYLYFLNLYDDKALYSYNTITGTLLRITSNKVSDFAILGDTLYFNAVTVGVNNNLYKANLKLGGAPELVSKKDCNDIVTDGEYIYYSKHNAAGAATAITKISGNTETDIYDKGVDCLTYYKGYLYFVDSNKLQRINVANGMVGSAQNVTNKDVSHVGEFYIYEDVVYFRELYGFGWGFKRLSKMSLNGSNYSVLVSTNTDPLALYVEGGYVYYYNDVISGTSGLHRISINAINGQTQPEVLLDANSGTTPYYAANFTVIGNNIYFINYRLNLGDSHLYCLDLTTKQVAKIA